MFLVHYSSNSERDVDPRREAEARCERTVRLAYSPLRRVDEDQTNPPLPGISPFGRAETMCAWLGGSGSEELPRCIDDLVNL